MKTFSIHLVRNVLGFVIALGLGYVAYTVNLKSVPIQKAEATASQNVSGWAWSGETGWISFNNTTDGSANPYGVNIDLATGNFSGYAWSENIGWITFDRTTANNPPVPPFNTGSGPLAQVNLTTGAVTGWARALAGCQTVPGTPATSCASSGAGAASGGWDGWIKLSDDTVPSWTGQGVKVNPSTGDFSGYAWGGDMVVGWIDFAPGTAVGKRVKIQAPSCTATDTGVVWSNVCVPTGVCTGPAKTAMVPGVEQGSCPFGGAPVSRSCTVSQTCVATPGHPICGDGICTAVDGESFGTCPADCKIKQKFQQF